MKGLEAIALGLGIYLVANGRTRSGGGSEGVYASSIPSPASIPTTGSTTSLSSFSQGIAQESEAGLRAELKRITDQKNALTKQRNTLGHWSQEEDALKNINYEINGLVKSGFGETTRANKLREDREQLEVVLRQRGDIRNSITAQIQELYAQEQTLANKIRRLKR